MEEENVMQIRVTPARKDRLKEKPEDDTQLGFGDIFTDHMFLMDYVKGKGWFNPRVEPYHHLAIDPAAMALHYGQELFEGLKAYRGQDDGIYLFRARDNFKRLNMGAKRLVMAEVDIDLAMEGMKS